MYSMYMIHVHTVHCTEQIDKALSSYSLTSLRVGIKFRVYAVRLFPGFLWQMYQFFLNALWVQILIYKIALLITEGYFWRDVVFKLHTFAENKLVNLIFPKVGTFLFPQVKTQFSLSQKNLLGKETHLTAA